MILPESMLNIVDAVVKVGVARGLDPTCLAWRPVAI